MYREALSLLEAGKQALAKMPRADMPGFQPAQPDVLREQRYVARTAEELRMREALVRGEHAYESPRQP